MSEAGTTGKRRVPWLALLPLLIFAALAGLFLVRLDTKDTQELPSALIGKQTPQFTLPAIEGMGVEGFSSADLAQGHVSLVNIFASWCGPCRDEHPFLMQLSRDPKLKDMGVRIFGLNYKDDPQNARRFIAQYGDPYFRMGADRSGRTGIDWGAYGVPETFVVRGDGTIAYKHVGPITQASLREKLMPAIEAAARAR